MKQTLQVSISWVIQTNQSRHKFLCILLGALCVSCSCSPRAGVSCMEFLNSRQTGTQTNRMGLSDELHPQWKHFCNVTGEENRSVVFAMLCQMFSWSLFALMLIRKSCTTALGIYLTCSYWWTPNVTTFITCSNFICLHVCTSTKRRVSVGHRSCGGTFRSQQTGFHKLACSVYLLQTLTVNWHGMLASWPGVMSWLLMKQICQTCEIL